MGFLYEKTVFDGNEAVQRAKKVLSIVCEEKYILVEYVVKNMP